MSVIEITSKSQFDDLLRANHAVAVQAHANWCGPCRAITPYFETEAKNHADDDITFVRFDTDQFEDLVHELGVRSIPAFFAFQHGEKVKSVAGANPVSLRAMVQSIVPSN